MVKKQVNSEDKYRALLDRITDGFIALDTKFCYLYANQKIGELVKRDPATLIGKNVWQEFPESIGSYTYKAFQTAMREQRFISNIDYFEPLGLWQENYIYPSKDGLSVFIRDVTEQKKLESQLYDKEKNQQLQIIATTLDAQEKERTYIGQELHDNVNQIITATKLILTLMRDYPENLPQMIPVCIDNLEKVINENRKLAHELVTPNFTDEDFVGELSILASSMLATKSITLTIEHSGFNQDILQEKMKLSVYRILQEQCTNIVKYAEAKTVHIILSTTGDYFEMTIADDGKGMMENKSIRGIGLKNIEARLRLFDGVMQVHNTPGKGFQLHINIPFRAES